MTRYEKKSKNPDKYIEILVNNAGYVSGGEFLERPDADWERTIDVNLTALLYTTRAFLPAMYDRNVGHIVNISSAAGTIGVAGLAVYAATKWALRGWAGSLMLEVRDFNIRVITICTGSVDTEFHPESNKNKDTSRVPKADDIAQHRAVIVNLGLITRRSTVGGLQ